MVAPLRPVGQLALGAQIAGDLREQIILQRIPAGTHLAEELLAGSYDVSRGPIRDALRQLESEGFIESRKRGSYVLPFTTEDIVDLYSLREAIEGLAVQRAVEQAEPADWDAFDELVEAMSAAARDHDASRFAAADVTFHQRLYQMSHHRRLVGVWSQYEPILAGLLRVTVSVDEDLEPIAHDHAQLLRLLRAGASELLDREIRTHVRGSRDRMIQAYEQTIQLASAH